MLTVHQVSKSYGMDTILENISFSLNEGERLGLVGPNGSGKTTLLRILVGEERPDSGVVRFNPPHLQVGYLPQGLEPRPSDTIQSYLARQAGDLPTLTVELEELAMSLAKAPERADLQRRYDEVLAQIESSAESAGQGPAVLAGLGLGHFPPETPVLHLSGGQKTRLALAGVLLASPQLLLLDEPTNHLDLDMLAWLEGWLTGFSGAVLIVSHDRAFLDATATGILEIDPASHTLRQFPGNYSDYLEQKLVESERQWQEFKDQQEEIGRLQQAARAVRQKARFRPGGKGDSGDKFAKGFFANRTLETIRRAKTIEKRIERLMTEEKVEKPRQSWQMKLEFGDVPPSGRDVVKLEELAIGYGDEVLVRDINETVRIGARVALVGPNGAGKTTLLRTIAGMIPPLAGAARLGTNVRLGYMTQEQKDLDPSLNALETIRRLAPLSETDARTFLHQFLFSGDDVFLPVGKLSYGERARLSLGSLVASGCNLLLLDEPINHLDIPSRSRFEQALATFDGTVLAVVHDRYFIEGFATEIWEVTGDTIHKYERSD